MANYYYQYQNYCYFHLLIIVFILSKQPSMLTIAQSIQYQSTDALNARLISKITSTMATVLYNNDESYDDVDSEITDADDIYDEEGSYNDNNLPSTPISDTRYDNNNVTSQSREETTANQYNNDENGSYQEIDEEEEEEEEDDEEGNQIYGDTMSVNRPDYHHPTNSPNNKNSIDLSSTSRVPFISSNLWRDLFSKPAILVGIIGGIVVGILFAIILVMFIIYRMRKKDEGSYVLDEAPRKSPSHAYTRVSSREFFA